MSELLEPAGAGAEPYALCSIEAAPGVVPPCSRPAFRTVDDLGPIVRRKIFVFTLGHTFMVAAGSPAAAPGRS